MKRATEVTGKPAVTSVTSQQGYRGEGVRGTARQLSDYAAADSSQTWNPRAENERSGRAPERPAALSFEASQQEPGESRKSQTLNGIRKIHGFATVVPEDFTQDFKL